MLPAVDDPLDPGEERVRGDAAVDDPLREIVREVMPFLGVMLIALLIITYVPDFVLYLPRLFGYKG